MSSVRVRLNKLWSRNENRADYDQQNELGLAGPSLGSRDTKQSQSTSELTDSGSVGTVHKVASKALQSFADTIRSKTRKFYVKPGDVDASPKLQIEKSASPEPQVEKSASPKPQVEKSARSHSRRSIVWPSLKSRASHGSLNSEKIQADKQILQSRPSSLSILPTGPNEIAPEINVSIPNSPFLDVEDFKNNNPNLGLASAPEQPVAGFSFDRSKPMPGPTCITIPPFPQFGMPLRHLAGSTLLPPLSRDTPDNYFYESALFDQFPDILMTPSHAESQNIKDLDHGTEPYRSKNKNVGLDPFFPLILTASQYKKSPCLQAREANGPTPYPIGDRAEIMFRRDYNRSPYLSPCSSPYPLQVYCQGPSYTTSNSDISSPEGSDSHKEGTTRSDPNSVSSSIGKTSLEDDSSGLADPKSDILNSKAHICNARASSSSYEADTESIPSSPDIPSMGCRHEWNEVRADRDNRYFAIHSENPIEDSKSRLELLALSAQESDSYVSANSTKTGYVEYLATISPRIDLGSPESSVPREAGSNNSSSGETTARARPCNTSLLGPETTIRDCIKPMPFCELDQIEELPSASSDLGVYGDFVLSESSKKHSIEANERLSGILLDDSDFDLTPLEKKYRTASTTRSSHSSSYYDFENFANPVFAAEKTIPAAPFVNSTSLAEAHSLELTKKTQPYKFGCFLTDDDVLNESCSFESDDAVFNHTLTSPLGASTIESYPIIAHGLSARHQAKEACMTFENSTFPIPDWPVFLGENFDPNRKFNAARLPLFNISASNELQFGGAKKSSDEELRPKHEYHDLMEASGGRMHCRLSRESFHENNDQALSQTKKSPSKQVQNLSSKEGICWRKHQISDN